MERCFINTNESQHHKIEIIIFFLPGTEFGFVAEFKGGPLYRKANSGNIVTMFFFRKTIISYPLKRTRTRWDVLIRRCAYQGVGSNSFSEKFEKILNEWSHSKKTFVVLFLSLFPTQPAFTCSNLIEILEQGVKCSKLTIRTPQRRCWCRSVVFIVISEHISHHVLVFLLLT